MSGETAKDLPAFRSATEPGRWEGVDVLAYKEEGAAPFKSITRQVLFEDANLGCQMRYFEIAAGGHSTLERHDHVHAVMIARGKGQCLVGTQVRDVAERDLVHIPGMTWHQFRANQGDVLGFLCMVNVDRDKPQLPDAEQLAAMKTHPNVALFLRA